MRGFFPAVFALIVLGSCAALSPVAPAAEPADATTRIAAVAMASALGDPETNLVRVEAWATRARAEGATFAVFPEECLTGSLNKSKLSLAEARQVVERSAALAIPRLESLARRLEMTLAVGTIESADERLRNAVLVVGPDGFLGSYTKIHLPNENERAWFVEGDRVLVVRSQGWTFSVGICADLNYPEMFRSAARGGAEFFLLSVGCSGDGSRENAVRCLKEYSGLMRSAAVANGLPIFYADQAGPDRASLAFSMDLRGDVVDSLCGREGLVTTEISRGAIDRARAGGDPTNVRHVRPEAYENRVMVGPQPQPRVAPTNATR